MAHNQSDFPGSKRGDQPSEIKDEKIIINTMTADPNTDNTPKQTFTLDAGSEVRLEIPHYSSTSTFSEGGMCTIILRKGSAELFGSELAIDKPYSLSGTKVAIFTWHGCTVEVVGKYDIAYTSSETNANVAYVNTHAQLEVLRDEAMHAASSPNADPSNQTTVEGPRVMLVGPEDSGKSSLAKVLIAYAVKLGRRPLFVDLDVSQNSISVPGTIAVSPMTAESTSVQSYGNSGSSLLSGTTPLDLWYGSKDLTTNPDLYKKQLVQLGKNIDSRLKQSPDENSSGIIVNTFGWIEDLGYKLLLHSIDALRINVVLIMGHDRLYSMLTTATSSASPEDSRPTPKIIKLPRSGGVVSRDTAFRRTSRHQSIKQYFHGKIVKSNSYNNNKDMSLLDSMNNGNNPNITFTNQYIPSLIEIPFDEIRLMKLTSVSLSDSMLPVSSKQATDPVQLSSVDINPKLKHAILAVCHPYAVEMYDKSGMASDLYLSGVAGFVAVERVDVDRDILSVLAPASGDLPSNILLIGDITWME